MEIVKASYPDSEKLGLVLGGVFRDHPLYMHMIEDAERRQRMANWLNKRVVAYGIRYGTVFTDDERIGACVIMPATGGAITIPRMIRMGVHQAPFRMGWSGFRKFMKFSSQTEEIRKRLMPEKHYFQLTVGVNPNVQGKGVGSALLRAGIELAESDGLDAYAETMLENVVGWYDKYGYRTVEVTDIPEIGPFYSMVRKAGS